MVFFFFFVGVFFGFFILQQLYIAKYSQVIDRLLSQADTQPLSPPKLRQSLIISTVTWPLPNAVSQLLLFQATERIAGQKPP